MNHENEIKNTQEKIKENASNRAYSGGFKIMAGGHADRGAVRHSSRLTPSFFASR